MRWIRWFDEIGLDDEAISDHGRQRCAERQQAETMCDLLCRSIAAAMLRRASTPIPLALPTSITGED